MEYTIYTDGGYSQIHDVGAFAYVMLDEKQNIVKKGAWKIEKETNNRAELKAIITGVYHLPQDCTFVTIKSDSQYALFTLSGKWGRKSNTDLFDVWDKVKKDRNILIDYQWVRGHSGDMYNEMCDTMCNDAVGFDLNKEFEKYRKKH